MPDSDTVRKPNALEWILIIKYRFILKTKKVIFYVGYYPENVHSVRERTNLDPTGLDQFFLSQNG